MTLAELAPLVGTILGAGAAGFAAVWRKLSRQLGNGKDESLRDVVLRIDGKIDQTTERVDELAASLAVVKERVEKLEREAESSPKVKVVQ